jgi:hypothetical protein
MLEGFNLSCEIDIDRGVTDYDVHNRQTSVWYSLSRTHLVVDSHDSHLGFDDHFSVLGSFAISAPIG